MDTEPISIFILSLGLLFALVAVVGVYFFPRFSKITSKKSFLKRHALNPIFSPPPFSDWEAVGTFNPAAIKDDQGRIHIIYRAIGADGISRFGYARSDDGYSFSDRSPYPVFSMVNPRYGLKNTEMRFDPVMYPSGGSWGGAEDPRMIRMNGKIYLTFNAFDGWDYIRMAVASIDEDDFFNKRWKWSKPLLISPPGQIHKNWVLFPEKIKGKFAILHSINPEIQIDYVDRLEDLSFGFKKINSKHGGKPREGWDTYVRGVGPPPIKTDKGWLVLYHAIDKDDPGNYKLGAMLLDLKNPKKIIARSKVPLLLPSEWYENDWKPGVVYACGAVIKGEDLMVYYGGGDKHVCIAHTSLSALIDLLLS